MKPVELNKKLNSFLIDGLGKGVFIDYQVHTLTGSLDSQAISPTNTPGMITLNIGILEYVHLIENRLFSIMFNDYALVIIECLFSHSRLIKHRYTYIPCPIDQEEMKRLPEDTPITDWLLELAISKGIESFRSVGTYRFDFAPKQAAKDHPISHITIGSPECRMPVRAPLSISDFLNFLFDNFYLKHKRFWHDYSPFLTCYGIEDDTITQEETIRHHINWVIE